MSCFTIYLCVWFRSSDTLLSHVEQLLRAFILKISVCDAVLNNNPPGNFTNKYGNSFTLAYNKCELSSVVLMVKMLRVLLYFNRLHVFVTSFGTGCSFSVLVHTREVATRSMEKVQVIKVTLRTVTNRNLMCGERHVCFPKITCSVLHPQDFPWIVADEQEVHMTEPRLIPLKTMTSDIVKVSQSPTCRQKGDRNFEWSSCFWFYWMVFIFTDAAVRGGESPENIGHPSLQGELGVTFV